MPIGGGLRRNNPLTARVQTGGPSSPSRTTEETLPDLEKERVQFDHRCDV